MNIQYIKKNIATILNNAKYNATRVCLYYYYDYDLLSSLLLILLLLYDCGYINILNIDGYLYRSIDLYIRRIRPLMFAC